MEDVQQDILVSIADLLEAGDLKSLRLVSKRLYEAVGQSAIKLRPRSRITSCHLDALGDLFSSAGSLNLSGCQLLDNASLKGIPFLFPHIRQLDLGWCRWLSPFGVAHLGRNSLLESLNLIYCPGLKTLPEAISGLVALKDLNLFHCSSLETLPEGVRGLRSLRTLNLSWCENLELLPESLGSLAHLQRLNLSWCDSLTKLPDTISTLTSLVSLNLRSCVQLGSLPEALGGLSALTELQLAGCPLLEKLPESLADLLLLQVLGLAEWKALSKLPTKLGCLSELRILDVRYCVDLYDLPEGVRELGPKLRVRLDGCPDLAWWLMDAAGLGP